MFLPFLLSFFVCLLLSPHPPPVLPVQRRDHLGPVQPVQESVPRDLSLYSVLNYSLCIEMFPREYLPTQGRDDSFTAGVFQCSILYHTILYKMFCTIPAILSQIDLCSIPHNSIQLGIAAIMRNVLYSIVWYSTVHWTTPAVEESSFPCVGRYSLVNISLQREQYSTVLL